MYNTAADCSNNGSCLIFSCARYFGWEPLTFGPCTDTVPASCEQARGKPQHQTSQPAGSDAKPAPPASPGLTPVLLGRNLDLLCPRLCCVVLPLRLDAWQHSIAPELRLLARQSWTWLAFIVSCGSRAQGPKASRGRVV